MSRRCNSIEGWIVKEDALVLMFNAAALFSRSC